MSFRRPPREFFSFSLFFYDWVPPIILNIGHFFNFGKYVGSWSIKTDILGQWKLYFRGSIIIRACWKQGWSSYFITMRMWLWGKGYFEFHWVIWGQIQAFLNPINYISRAFTHIDRNYKNPRLYWSQFILLRYVWHGLGSKPYRFILSLALSTTALNVPSIIFFK